MTVKANEVFDVLRKSILVDGFDIVIDMGKSKGSYIIDARNGRKFLDFYTFFASSPLGMNHPKLANEEFKGLIEGGLDADITIFDPQKIIDKATYKNPTEPPEGIEWVIVNGELAVRNGKLTNNIAGRPIVNPRRRIK